MFDIFRKYNKTNFKSGYLLEDHIPLTVERTIKTDKNFIAPRKIDNRDICLCSSDQGNTPHCAGFATAGFIEFHNWRLKHYPEQVDGKIIYLEAKKNDGFSGDGTYLNFATKAAIDLNLIRGKPKKVVPCQNDVKFAIHEYGVCIAGFRITDEWNIVEKKNGTIINLRDKAKNRGGHAVLLCGYHETEGVYIQNSWGESWGVYGFAILSWEQFSRQIFDAMVIDEISIAA